MGATRIDIGEDAEKRKKKVNLTVREMDIDDLAAVFHLGE